MTLQRSIIMILQSTASIESRIPQSDLVDRLKRATSKKEIYRRTFGELRFHGRITPPNFKIQEITDYADPAKPIVLGKITDLGDRRVVEIKMKAHSFAIAFSVIWASAVLAFGFFDITRSISNMEFHFTILTSPTMLVFLYFFLPYRFYKQCDSIAEKISNTIDGRIEQ